MQTSLCCKSVPLASCGPKRSTGTGKEEHLGGKGAGPHLALAPGRGCVLTRVTRRLTLNLGKMITVGSWYALYPAPVCWKALGQLWRSPSCVWGGCHRIDKLASPAGVPVQSACAGLFLFLCPGLAGQRGQAFRKMGRQCPFCPGRAALSEPECWRHRRTQIDRLSFATQPLL